MSEPTADAVPLSASRGPPPRKKARHLPPTATASASQANEIENLMYDPERPVDLPPTSTAKKSTLAAPPEIVANVQGSSAGAGSGEFHVYKASRRREYERLRTMDEESKKEEDQRDWEDQERNRKAADEERTRKNRDKRNRRKKKGKGGKDEVDEDSAPGIGELKREKKDLKIREVQRGSREGTPNGVGVAEVLKENGITIHDDD